MADEFDYMQALRTMLMDESGLERVYVDGLPKGKLGDRNPVPAVALNMAGGLPRFGQIDNLPIAQQRFDVICYGETALEATKIYRKVASILRGMVRQVVDGVLLIRIVKSGGVISLIDDETDLPIKVQSFELVAQIA